MIKPPEHVITSTPRRRATTRASTSLQQQNRAVKTALAERGGKTGAGQTSSDHSKINV
jgi:hypothetical protein